MKIFTCVQWQKISAKCHYSFKMLFISSSDLYSLKESQVALLLLVCSFDCTVNEIPPHERGKAGRA